MFLKAVSCSNQKNNLIIIKMDNWEKEINQRSVVLIDEFKSHCKDVLANTPSDMKYTKSDLFEGWAMQKIASLQLAVEGINKVSGGPFLPDSKSSSDN